MVGLEESVAVDDEADFGGEGEEVWLCYVVSKVGRAFGGFGRCSPCL